jgi:hypothetical protein
LNRIFIPTSGPTDWQRLLAEPNRHWKPGYSAHALATCWETSKGLPTEVSDLFSRYFGRLDLLLAIPEYKVPLPGGRRESQSDLFCLLQGDGAVIAMMVEGKVEEPFDKTIGEWLAGASDGKKERLSFLTKTLGLSDTLPPSIRYQLLHRTAAAVITARRFGAAKAAMIVHSFSPARSWLPDFQMFVGLWDISIGHDEMVRIQVPDGFELFLGWASGSLNKAADI